MTTAADISSCIESLRTCGICSHICRSPRTLECLHTFCLECLKILINQDSIKSICCPKCELKILPAPGCSVDSTYLESLATDTLSTETSLSSNGINPNVSCKEHQNHLCHYYYTDSLELACDLCKRNRPECCKTLDLQTSVEVRDLLLERVNSLLTSSKNNLTEICNTLNSRERQILTKNDEMMLGIMQYFGDLKMKLLEYLTKHEENILAKLNKFTTNEVANIRQQTDQCLSLLDNLSSNFLFTRRKFKKSDDPNAVQGYVGLDRLRPHLEGYTTKVASINDAILDETDIRFIINIEFEDMLTEGDLVNVELLNSTTRASGVISDSSRDSTSAHALQEQTTQNPSHPTNYRTTAVTITPPSSDQTDDPPPSFSEPPLSGFHHLTPSAPSPEDFVDAPTVPRGLTHGAWFESVTPTGRPKDKRLRFLPLTTFPTRVRGNEQTPIFGDICWIDDKALIVIDKQNKCLKVFNTSGHCVKQLHFNMEPYGCTVFDTGQLAVTFPKNKMITKYVISLNDYTGTYTGNCFTSKGYTSLSYYKPEKWFICATTTPFSFPSVDILELQHNGECIHIKSYKDYNGVLFGYPRCVEINTEGVIAVSDYKTSRVILLDIWGGCKGVFDGSRSRNVHDPQGIGLYDNLFIIADTRGNHIFCIDSEMQVCGELDPDKTPRFIDINHAPRPVMAIGCGNGNISLFKIRDNRPRNN